MANHKSSVKRIRQTESRRLRNRYYAKTARNAVVALYASPTRLKLKPALPKVRNASTVWPAKGTISKNKASNLKSKLALHINKLAATPNEAHRG